ncbi:hypothetical protein BGZ94_005478 [Podila epigama]|nr:hypothetical protein BGZ94_005478 [Podila epigama]
MPPKSNTKVARPAKRVRQLAANDSGSEADELPIPLKQKKKAAKSDTVSTENRTAKPMKELPLSSRENQENIVYTKSTHKQTKKLTTVDEDITKPKRAPRAPPAMTNEQLVAALEELEAKYQNLKKLRVTDAERHLEDYQQKLEEATRSAEQYRTQTEQLLDSAQRMQEKLRDSKEELNAKVRTLEQQVREYERKAKARAQEDKIKSRKATMESVLASPDVTPQIAAHTQTIHMYEDITGIKIVPRTLGSRAEQPTGLAIWDCEHSGTVGKDSVTYTPRLDPTKDRALIEHLPDYLTDEIEFEKQYESKFFWRLLNYNNETV